MVVLGVAVWSVSLCLTGCAQRNDELIDTGVVQLAPDPDKRGYYRDIHAYLVGDGMQVTGYVRRSIQPAYVHVEVQDSAGRTIISSRVEVRRVPRSSRVRHARFETFLSVPASGVTVVRIRHHVGRCDETVREDWMTPTDWNGV